MPEFVIVRESPRPASEVFARLVDWDAHSAAIPLTRLHHDGEPRRGQRFVARTGVGVLGFDDPMEVELFRRPSGDLPDDLPGLVEVVKRGRVIGGRVRWTVSPTRGGSRVEWRQQFRLGRLPRLFDPLVGALARASYAAGLRRLLR